MGRAVRRGKLLRYATKEEALASGQSPRDNGNDSHHEGNGTIEGKLKGPGSSKGDSKNGTSGKSGVKNEDLEREDSGIAGEAAFLRLGEKEGVVDCMYCWWMRRDLFEVPALIVINVSVLEPWYEQKLTMSSSYPSYQAKPKLVDFFHFETTFSLSLWIDTISSIFIGTRKDMKRAWLMACMRIKSNTLTRTNKRLYLRCIIRPNNISFWLLDTNFPINGSNSVRNIKMTPMLQSDWYAW
jgi:hypothetical protein